MDHYPPLPDSQIIHGNSIHPICLETTTHLYLTVQSSSGTLSISTCVFHHPGDHYPLQPGSIILGPTTHHYLTVPSSLVSPPTFLLPFHRPGDHYLVLPDSSIIIMTTAQIYLTVPSFWGPLLTSARQFHHPLGDHHIDCLLLPNLSLIQVTTTHFYLTVPSFWGTLSSSK